MCPSSPTFEHGVARGSLEYGESESTVHRRLQRGDAEFSVALHGVTVTGAEHRARNVDGNVHCRAGTQSFVIHITAVRAGQEGRLDAELGWGGDAHLTEEGTDASYVERDGNAVAPGWERDTTLQIDGDDHLGLGRRCV